MPDWWEIESQSLLGCLHLRRVKGDSKMFTETREGLPVLSPAPLSLCKVRHLQCAHVNPLCPGRRVIIPLGALPLALLLMGSSHLWPLPHLEDSTLSLSLSLQNSSNEFWCGGNSSQEGRLCTSNLNLTASVGEFVPGDWAPAWNGGREKTELKTNEYPQ